MTSQDRARRVGLLGVVCGVALLVAPQAWAGVGPVPFRTGLFGVAAGQSVRISVLNTGDFKGIINPCFRVWDASGRQLFEQHGDPVPAGHGASIEFAPLPAGGTVLRTQVRVEVEIEPEDEAGARIGVRAWRRLLRNVVPSLEVFDTTTGRTVFTMPYAEVAFNPQPEPPDPNR